MKKKNLIPLLILAVFSASCGAQPPPTMSPADVQGTAVAAAWTMVAATEQAIPTITPLPPTEIPSPTPPPTFTPPAFPTSSLLGQPTSALSAIQPTATRVPGSSGDPCNKTLTTNPESKQTNLRLDNQTKAPVTLSIYLFENAYGECGYRGYNLGGGSKATVEFPFGCYYFGAFVNDPKKPSKTFGGGSGSCAYTGEQWTVRITLDRIELIP